VRVVSLAEALQIVEVHMAIESLRVARAAERITDEQIVALGALAAHLKLRADSGNIEGFADLTHTIFETYVQIADQPVAAEMLAHLRARSNRPRRRRTVNHGRRATGRSTCPCGARDTSRSHGRTPPRPAPHRAAHGGAHAGAIRQHDHVGKRSIAWPGTGFPIAHFRQPIAGRLAR
jgi:hypothetical protein